MSQKDNKDIPTDITVRQLQKYIWKMNIDKGFNIKDPSKKLVTLMEEVGELARSVRKVVGIKFTDTTKKTDLEEELADVQIVLLGLASMMGVDMVDAVSRKAAKNQERDWNNT